MSREGKRRKKSTSHTTRNIMILALVIIVVTIAAATLSAPPGPQFFLTVHVYNAPVEYQSYEQLTGSELVRNSTVTISGPRSFGPETTPTGILGIQTQVPSGSYTITATKPGYNDGTTIYVVGTDCTSRQLLVDGNVVCHVLVRITNSTQ